MIRDLKIGLISINFLMLLACNATFPETAETMEFYLNQKIGTEYDKRDWKYFKDISEDNEYIEKERTRKDGCSYALSINKKTNIIEKWRFTSERSLCKYYNPSYI